MDTKSPLASKTIWGALVVLIFGSWLSITVEEADQIGAAIGTLVGGAMAIYGRYKATAKVGPVKSKPPGGAGALLLLCAALPLLPACGSVGPTRTQGVEGQRSANSVLNGMTIADETGSFSAEAGGPINAITMDQAGFRSNKSSATTQDFLLQTPEGWQFALSSGTDVTARGVKVWSAGEPVLEIAEFTTSASEPTRAANEAWDRLKEIIPALSEDQRAVIERGLGVIEAAAPEVAGLLKALLVP